MRKILGFVGVMLVAGSALCAAEGQSSQAKYPQLAKLFSRMEAGERVKVAFLGGSITWGATATDPMRTSYRALVSAWLEERFPKSHVKSIDAAIGATGSKLAVFRMDRDVLPYKPDMTFIEFAVNDSQAADTNETMEGVIRKLHTANPEMAIIILVIGVSGASPAPTWNLHRELAAAYGLPCVDLIAPIREMMATGLTPQEFLYDGCHPNDKGYRIYTDIITTELPRLAAEKGTPTPFPAKPVTENRYESASMIELSTLPCAEWKPVLPSVVGTWFDHQPSRWQSSAVAPTKPDAVLKAEVECSGIGLYYETTKDGGPIGVKADGVNVFDIKTHMDLPNERIDWKFKLFDDGVKKRAIEIVAPKQEKTKAAYLFVTK